MRLSSLYVLSCSPGLPRTAAAADMLVMPARDASPGTPVAPSAAADAKVDRVITAMNDASTWGHPDLFGEFTGMWLYSEGHYKSAIKYFKYGALRRQASAAQRRSDVRKPSRVAKDPVTTCARLALAAQRKYPSFVATRDRVCEALTPAQHDQAVAELQNCCPYTVMPSPKHGWRNVCGWPGCA